MKKITVTATGISSTFRHRGGKNFFNVVGDFAGNTVKLQYSPDGDDWADCKDSNGVVEFTDDDGAWIELPNYAMRLSVTGGTAPNLDVYESDGYTND